jgi:hypothetical protein
MTEITGMVRFEGHLEAEAPLYVTYFGSEGRLPRTPHGEVFLNAGTFRGPLRKAGMKALRRTIARMRGIEESEVFDRAAMYMLGEGMDITRGVNNESADLDPMGELALRRLNPYLSLFGRWKLSSMLNVSELRTPIENLITAGQGVRHDLFERDAEEIQYLSEDEREGLMREIRSFQDSTAEVDRLRTEIREAKRAWRAAESDAEKKAAGERINELEAAVKAAKTAREGSEESIRHPIDGVEAIAPGARLGSRLTLVNGREVYLSLLLHSLAQFSTRPYLGAMQAKGFGEVSGEWTVMHRAPGSYQAERLGRVSLDALGFQMEGAALESAFERLESLIEGCDFRVFLLSQAKSGERAR